MVYPRPANTTPIASSHLSDRLNDTCQNAVQNDDAVLQAIFTFPGSPTSSLLSVEIVVKGDEECSELAWTWFVGTACAEGLFQQCALTAGHHDGEFTSCIVSCICPFGSCDSLHVKYEIVPWKEQHGVALCDVYLIHDPIEPLTSELYPPYPPNIGLK